MKRTLKEEGSDVPEEDPCKQNTSDTHTENEESLTKKHAEPHDEILDKKKARFDETFDSDDSDSDSDSFVGPARPADLDDDNDKEEEEEEAEEPFQLRFVPQSQRKTIPQQQQQQQYPLKRESQSLPETKQDKSIPEKPKSVPKKLMFKGDKKKQEEEEWKHKVKEMRASELLDMRCKKKSDRHCY